MLGVLDAEQIEQVLRSRVIGRIGCHAEGRTYVVPVTYVYDGQDVYGHTGEGLKVQMLRANPHVCFEVEEVDDLANWRSVIAWGVFEELHGQAAIGALQRLSGRLQPLAASETSLPAHGLGHWPVPRTDTEARPMVVYRIRLAERTGRFERR